MSDEHAAPSPVVPGGRRRRRGSGCLPILVVLAIVAGLGYLGVTRGIDELRDRFGGAEDYPGPGSGSVSFEVFGGNSLSTMGQNLEALGVVASSEAFVEAAKEEPRSSGIQQGFYRLRSEMAAADVVDLLVSGDTRGTQYTFLPGKTVDEIVELLARDTKLSRRDFEAALKDPDALGLPPEAEGSAEGYLFPGSYVFFGDSTATSILRDMVARWRSAADDMDLDARAAKLGYTTRQVMTIASMVQAEGSLLSKGDRRKIARVIYNRLEQVSPNPSAGFLQIDATVNYALGEKVARLTIAQIDSVADSPYNTYRTKGLPPGPIAAPDSTSIDAALAPADGDWFFYVTVNLRTAETKFAKTPAEFSQLEAEFDEYCATQSDRC
ncbi:endolytic transglycosylase MltG [Nocardioides sp. R-C-SC26]|uniref:endolytic transglycosylase MltG n=1 Tax=Nocardioides sp. R-C-SC26 TaxID=2870414 RepID=UPI001E4194BE|nr:endolytic transglycosylase MltG [Nocardioides sp. R-C-SC26]